MIPSAIEAKALANKQYDKNFIKDINSLIKELNNAIQNSNDHLTIIKSLYNKDALQSFLNKATDLGYTIEEVNGEAFGMPDYRVYKVKW